MSLFSYGHMFRMLSCAMGQRVNAALSGMELTSAQGPILGYLVCCKTPPCAKDIEERFQLSHPTVSGLLSRMEKKDFIAQKPDPEDRRRKLVYLRPKGLECTQTMSTVIQQNDNTLLQGFTQEEREQFRDYLVRAMHNLSPEFKEEFRT